VLNVTSLATARQLFGRVVIIGTLLASAASAQSLTFGRFGGRVHDAAERPVFGAEVRLEDRANGAVRWTQTARDGSFRFEVVPDGRYDVIVEALGYTPVVHRDVRIGVGHATSLEATIRATTPPVTRVDTVPRQGELVSSSHWLLDRGYADLLGPRRLGADIAALSTIADENSVEGLPWRFAGAMLEGGYAGSIAAPGGTGADAAGLSLPVRALSTAEVGGLGYDVEVGGSGVGIRGTTVRGGRRASSQSVIEGGTANLGASYFGGGPLHGDTAQGIVGGDYQRSEREFAAVVPPGEMRVDDRASLFGRLDWQRNDRLAISARASGSRYTSQGRGERTGLASLYGSDYEATSAQASLNIFGQLTRRISHEWRLSAQYGTASGRADDLTRIESADGPVSYGSPLGEPFEERRTTPRVSGMLHFDLGAHRLKAGFATATHLFDSQFARDADGTYAVGLTGAGTFEGAYRRVEATSFAGQFRSSESAIFVQDAWLVADGLSLILGARIDNTRIPVGEIEANSEWAALTELDNTAVESRESRFSPRVGVRWELGAAREWVIEGGAGTYQDLADGREIAEALTFDRGTDVRYGVGTLSMAGPPDLVAAPVVGRTITMLAPTYTAPRTDRLSLGITRRLSSFSASVTGVYRHTDFLSRRRDLNLPATPVGTDQYGRPLYGSLQQLEALLAVVPQSNRRFSAFDAAYVLESSGYSEFFGVTVGIERVREAGFSIGAQYTFSRTLDNVAGFAGTRISPFPDGLAGEDWIDGRSDLDIPHRVLIAADWRPSPAFSLGAVYRLRSGAPFTPGVRGGVDANGDGDWLNDPAFVDAAMPGMAALLADHKCLLDNSGAFVERNSCREPLVHRVDLRATIRVAQLAIGRVDLTLDALDLISVNLAPIDRALLLVDPGGTLTTNAGTGVTTVPYIVNPNFGERAFEHAPGIFWRIGLRITP